MPVATTCELGRGRIYACAHFVYLSPLAGLLFHKTRVDGGHDLVELLTGNIIKKVLDTGDIPTYKLKVLHRRDWKLMAGLNRVETVS